MSMDLSALPPNLCISPNLRASKILVDKPIINTPAVTPTPKPVRRFSSIRNESPLNHLTIDTATLAPARTVGLEVTTTKGPAGAQCQLFCHQSVVFANDRHPLLRSLDAAITPPIYRDHAGRRTTLVGTTEDASSQRSKMVFTIGMQHFRQAGDGTSMQRQWLLSIASHLDRFLRQWTSSGHHHHHAQVQDGMIRLHPVLLHQSDRIVESWRVRPSQPEDIISETLRLEISATTASLQPTSPIQLQVKVMTQPIVHDAFGNTDMIRKGEAVLMEGLALARMMAKAVGWTCQEEDDSHMVEWVRDQMNIQWDHEPASKVRTLHPVCSHVEGLQTYSRSRTASGGGGGSRVMTPSLSPYPSRSQSFRATRKSEHGSSSGGSEKRDSTLAQLQEVSENLEVHARKVQPTTVTDEDHLRVPPPKDGSTPPSPQQRPGLRTSFGGFSSLNDSRMQTRALAAETEDHLSKALVNKGSPSIGSSSPGLGLGSGPQERHKQEPLTGAFSEGIGLGDLLGGYNNNNNNGKGGASPEPRKLSKFSIKSYQLERSNGLSDDWGIGGIGSLDTSLGKATMSGTTSGSGDLLSTPPLIADIGLPGTVSPITPSPEQVPVTITGGTTDFLQGLNITVNGARHDGSGIGISISDGIGIGLDSVGNQDNTMMLEANPMEQKSRRSFSSFSIRNNGHNSNLTSNDMMHKESASLKIPSPLEAPAELIHDFLGESLAMSPKPTKTSMERARSDSDVTGSSTKSVHFAADEGSGMGVGPIHRVHSDPITTTTTQPYSQHHHHHQHQQQQQQQQQYIDQDASSPGLGLSRSSSSSSSLSGESPTSKAHHTRRSWGKGIGGNDILGLQGLSE
ncbi:hypothetical protein B0O80DRAFT_272544 [Mortierella sp. GBAus27b]|nr:hypothetical protein B0O80DRAFT_272544 [Mortierella sp. GBAus27b]